MENQNPQLPPSSENNNPPIINNDQTDARQPSAAFSNTISDNRQIPPTYSPSLTPPTAVPPNAIYPPANQVPQNLAVNNQALNSPASGSAQFSNPPVDIYSANSQAIKKANLVRNIHWRIVIPIILGGFGILLLFYFIILPIYWANNYLSSIKAPYNTQTASMTTVYISFSRPVFTSNTTTDQSDSVDLSYTQGVITKGLSATTSLKSKNHLIVLPLTTWLHPVSKANKQYIAMKQYVGDSKSFLSDYQTLSTYITQLEKIQQNQAPQVNSSIAALAQANNASQLLTASQNATAALGAFITSLKTLHPSIDVQGLNTNLITNFNTVNVALLGVTNGIETRNSAELSESGAQLQSGAISLGQALNINTASLLQNNSVIKQQINKLQSEHPLN
jgi:hypothetical protein